MEPAIEAAGQTVQLNPNQATQGHVNMTHE